MGLQGVSTGLLVVVIGVFVALKLQSRSTLPKHLLGHKVIFQEDLLSNAVADKLMRLAQDMAEFPTNQNAASFYKIINEHVGEAQPLVNGTCAHPMMVPNQAKTQCILAGRIDVGRHYIKTGGVMGLKESYDQLVSRLQSFGRYMFDPEEYPDIAKLFSSRAFQDLAKAVCPEDRQLLDPFQFNFILQVPGQTVATHIDAPYFKGATRFHYPQWLLAAMVFSGLFEDLFVHQVQVVAYFHQWNDNKTEFRARGSNFCYWDDNGEPKSVPPKPLAGSAVDGSKTAHAALVYKPGVKAPMLDRVKKNILKYVGDDKWVLTSDGATVQEYTTEDIRATIVYRARCFANEEQRDEFRKSLENPEQHMMPLEEIMDRLKNDLVARGRLDTQSRDSLPRLELLLLIIDEYIKYPLPPTAAVPYNYCALPRLMPWTAPLLSWLC